MNHILIDCVFARQVWLRVLSPPGWAALSPPRGSWLQDWWSSSRVCLPEHLRSSFDSLVLLVSWQLWKERNSRVFDSALASVAVVLESIRSEGQLWSLAGVAFFWGFLGTVVWLCPLPLFGVAFLTVVVVPSFKSPPFRHKPV